MPVSIEAMRQNAEAVKDEADQRLVELRAERSRINDAIKVTLAERNEAESVAKKLAPRKPKTVAEPVDLADEIDAVS
jgi:hypothetical protein